MPAYLDDQTLPPAPTLRALLDQARLKLADTPRRVVEVRIDDLPMTAEQIERHLDQPTGASDVRLVSADAVELAVDTLDQAHAQLAAVNDLQTDASELLQSDRSAEAFQKLGEAVMVWARVAQAVGQACAFTHLPLQNVRVEGTPALELMQAFAVKLGQLKQSLIDRDELALADALAHEWPPLAKQWSGLIDTLIRDIEAGS